MARVMKWAAVIFFLLTAVWISLYYICGKWALPFAITFATCFYHFAMRLLVGCSLQAIMKNRANYRKAWYQLRPFEARFYQILMVKKWKGHMPSFDPSFFDPRLHSWEEIAQAMCQAELVHEIIIVLSFVPLLAAIPFGAFPVFLVTSLLSACYDLSFVLLQRFNRPRILRFIEKERTVK